MNTDYKKKLEEEREILMSELGGVGNRDAKSHDWQATLPTADPNEADPNNTADRFEDFEEKSALIMPLEARLAQVEGALSRLTDGTFGKCRVCGNAIEDNRLGANPAAETCIAHLES